jgi:hypothetical protein
MPEAHRPEQGSSKCQLRPADPRRSMLRFPTHGPPWPSEPCRRGLLMYVEWNDAALMDGAKVLTSLANGRRTEDDRPFA